jgi:transposase
MLCRQMEDLMQRIQQLLEQIPSAKEMMIVPGVGWVTVAGFLAVVGGWAVNHSVSRAES